MKRVSTVWVGIILFIGLGLRLVSLDADPPPWLSWSAGIYSDEGIYSEDARLWVLYGQHMQGDFQIAAVAPLHNLLLLHVFRAGWISLKAVRLVAVVFGMATLIAFWAMVRAWKGERIALIALLLLATSAPFVLYNRLGLLETPALFWLTVGFACLASAAPLQDDLPLRHTHRPDTARLALAGLFAAVAVAWKATFLLGAIPLLIAAARLYKGGALATGATFIAALGLYAAVFVRPYHAEISRVGHFYLFHQYLPHTAAGVLHNLKRGLFTGAQDGVIPYLLSRSGLAVLAAAGYALYRSPEKSRDADSALWLWLCIPIAAFLFCNYTPSRYFLIFWPALIALAACGIAQIKSAVAASGALGLIVLANAAMLGLWWKDRTYTVRNDAAVLQRVLPHDAWIIGQFAPELCLNNSLRSMYIQKGLANDTLGNLALLPVTHVLATDTRSRSADPWADKYNELIADPGGLRTLPIGKSYTVTVYANQYALP